jgi:hypothetical protein
MICIAFDCYIAHREVGGSSPPEGAFPSQSFFAIFCPYIKRRCIFLGCVGVSGEGREGGEACFRCSGEFGGGRA